MKSNLDIIVTPSQDTPGTLVALRYDDKQYLFGSLAEGTSRALTQRRQGIRKIDNVFLTGPTRWENIGGLLGFLLSIADVKKTAAAAEAQAVRQKNDNRKRREAEAAEAAKQGGKKAKMLQGQKLPQVIHEPKPMRLQFHGAPNLNYAIATARRFIFRTGVPVSATEHSVFDSIQSSASDAGKPATIEPTYADDAIRVWALPIQPGNAASTSNAGRLGNGAQSRKRSFEDTGLDEGEYQKAQRKSMGKPKQVVDQMFGSDWKMDRLEPKMLSEMKNNPRAALFIKDPETKKVTRYTGPDPWSTDKFDDVQVLVRQPWPAVMAGALPKTEPDQTSVCYLAKNLPRRGKFLVKKAQEFGVEDKLLYRNLTAGETVKNKHGEDVTPEMVMEPTQNGRGFAIFELPTDEYIDSLASRPELNDPGLLEGVVEIVWILGPGVSTSHKVRSFMESFKDVEHIISSLDSCPNTSPLGHSIRSAFRHNQVDSDVFMRPYIRRDPAVDEAVAQISGGSTKPILNSVPAEPGYSVLLEPRCEKDRRQIVEVQSESTLEQDAEREVAPFMEQIKAVKTDEFSHPFSDQHYDDVEIISLGTGSSHPSIYRNVSGTLVRVPDCGTYLLDCGEGTLGTLKRMYPGKALDELMQDLKAVWISHLHADHHLGTTSLLKAWYQSVHAGKPGKLATDAESDLLADGPRLGVISDVAMLEWLSEYANVEDFGFSRLLPIAFNNLPAQRMNAQRLDLIHSLPAFAYTKSRHPLLPKKSSMQLPTLEGMLGLSSIQPVSVAHCNGALAVTIETRTGFKFSYSGDCRPSSDFAAAGKGSHVLIHEATFEDDMRGEALSKKHSTSGEAIMVAANMGAKVCVLTHFSQRYPKMPSIGVETNGNQQSLPSNPATAENSNLSREATEGNVVDPEEMQEDDEQDEAEDESPPTVEDMGQNGVQKVIKSGVLDRDELNELVRERGIHVLVAFDYMRLRLKDVTKLEAKQPILKALYEKLAADKDLDAESHDGDQIQEGSESRSKKKDPSNSKNPGVNPEDKARDSKEKAEARHKRRVDKAKEKEEALMGAAGR